MTARSRSTTSRPLGTVRPSRAGRSARATALLAAGLLLAPFSLGVGAARAQQGGLGQSITTPQQQQQLDDGIGPSRSGSILDATNPIDLMNRIRRATALDNATPPGDAIDAALRDFEAGSQPAGRPAAPGSAAGSGLMQAP
ncbi:hypothetical protein [Cyanobium sp. CH-040]|uniref:hypothetical protein n=1 Tax=Cyanobium sp. CH-040 TaxID=2823708 RepID=UPI0020CF121C|nr:hypothetical protein [Cyanobium sp. CH-040]